MTPHSVQPPTTPLTKAHHYFRLQLQLIHPGRELPVRVVPEENALRGERGFLCLKYALIAQLASSAGLFFSGRPFRAERMKRNTATTKTSPMSQ